MLAMIRDNHSSYGLCSGSILGYDSYGVGLLCDRLSIDIYFDVVSNGSYTLPQRGRATPTHRSLVQQRHDGAN